jgi:hypothetical protein
MDTGPNAGEGRRPWDLTPVSPLASLVFVSGHTPQVADFRVSRTNEKDRWFGVHLDVAIVSTRATSC